jgi:hypothetical protein
MTGEYIQPADVAELTGLTLTALAGLRCHGTGPLRAFALGVPSVGPVTLPWVVHLVGIRFRGLPVSGSPVRAFFCISLPAIARA